MSNEATTPERPWRWVIIALLFLGTVINYFDRLALPTLAPVATGALFLLSGRVRRIEVG